MALDRAARTKSLDHSRGLPPVDVGLTGSAPVDVLFRSAKHRAHCRIVLIGCRGSPTTSPTRDVSAVLREEPLMFRRLTGLTVAALLLFCASARAQESASGGIAGQVLDPTRAALPGATVTVINAGTNAQRVVTTDAEGRFTVPNLDRKSV